MGNKNTKTLETDKYQSYSCSVTINGGNPIELIPDKINTQFGNKYIYFPVPQDFLKCEFSTLNLFYQNFSVTPNMKDSSLIIKNNSESRKNIIDGVEYQEYNTITSNGGKFILRVNTSNINKSLIVYSNRVEKI